ncbi:MAG: DUF4923 family protein, partial [Lachnospiraceae bacterium]|nr:DUF4923 family protein [Lachnospiraceae bacterium]
MKKILSIFTILAILCAAPANAFDFTKILGGGKTSGSGSSSADGLGSLLNGLAGELLSTSDFEIQDIVGTWKYAAPAVSLEGSNALQNLGGAAATSVIENKLAPYYEKAKLTNLEITFSEDSAFTMNAGLYKAHGTIAYSAEEGLIFNFQAFQSMNLGKVKAQASKLGNNELSLTFDISKLQGVVSKVADIAKNDTFKQLSAMLSSYQGVYAGFKLSRVEEPSAGSEAETPTSTGQ